jgi:hypothetical protein
MKSSRALIAVVIAGMVAGALRAEEPLRPEARESMGGRGVVNWAAPLYWSPGETAQVPADSEDREMLRDKATPALTTSAVPLIGITPCRLVDTRDASYPPGSGPPQLSAGVPRSFVLAGQCGIAVGAQAVSLNVTVVSPTGLGYVLLYPQGGSQPVVSTLNFTVGQTVANAAIVPLSASGSITVAAALSNTELLIDTNGYYAAAGVGAANTFLGVGAGNFTMTGDNNSAFGRASLVSNTSGNFNTAVGVSALGSNTAGEGNTASGAFALFANSTGNGNTAIGILALSTNLDGSSNTASGSRSLFSNTSGSNNTATGYEALYSNTNGADNTATGFGALVDNTGGGENTAVGFNALNGNSTGDFNTASGSGALQSNTTGNYNTAHGADSLYFSTTADDNTAVGFEALEFNDTGADNTAIGISAMLMNTTGNLNTALGEQALYANTTGINNTALGAGAGNSHTSGDNNIYIGNLGDASPTESNAVRIGSFGVHQRVYVTGILGVTGAAGVAMQIFPDGQLGTISSSARYKDQIQDMADASSALMRLRPVTYCFKGQAGGGKQFGLVAEEVEDVLPDLVVRNAAGEVEAVSYHEMPAMLLNELQKQQKQIERQDMLIADLLARLSAMEAQLPSAPVR